MFPFLWDDTVPVSHPSHPEAGAKDGAPENRLIFLSLSFVFSGLGAGWNGKSANINKLRGSQPFSIT
jgi:hypothetical protein